MPVTTRPSERPLSRRNPKARRLARLSQSLLLAVRYRENRSGKRASDQTGTDHDSGPNASATNDCQQKRHHTAPVQHQSGLRVSRTLRVSHAQTLSLELDYRGLMSVSQPRISFRSVPNNEVPVTVPIHIELNRSDELVLWLTDLHVYTVGFEFTIHARRRTADIMLDMYGFGRPSSASHSGPHLLGIEYADGTLSSNLPGPNNAGGLQSRGGSGGPGWATASYFRHPLPTDGPMQIATAWPFFGLPERVVELDGRLIKAAAERVETLWPEPAAPDGPAFGGRQVVHPLELTPGGWFATRYPQKAN